MFVGLIQRCEQIAMPTVTLSQAMDVFDERFYGLPNLIDALSAIIIEMTNVRKTFSKNFFFFFYLNFFRLVKNFLVHLNV